MQVKPEGATEGQAAVAQRGGQGVARRSVLLSLALGALGARVDAAPAALKFVTISLVPWGAVDAGGHLSGIFIDLAQQIGRVSGLRVDNHVAPNARAQALVASGQADLMFALKSDYLQRAAQAIARVDLGEIIVVGRAGSDFRSREDLHGKVVGQIRGADYDAAFTADSAIGKRDTTSFEQSLQMLMVHRLDAVIGSRLSLFYTLRQMGLRRSQLGQPLMLGRGEAWLYYSDKRYDPAVAATLRRALAELNREGAVRSLVQHYVGNVDDRG